VSVKTLVRVRTSSALTDRARLALCGITPVGPSGDLNERIASFFTRVPHAPSRSAARGDFEDSGLAGTRMYDRPRSRSVRDVLDAMEELSPRFDRLAMFESDAGAPIEFLGRRH
jgi:hypothetical protein